MKKNNIVYYVWGAVLAALAAGFAAYAMKHPELTFPWPDWVSYIIYAMYGIYTVIVFIMPRIKGTSPAACFLAGIAVVGLAFVVIFIGTRNTPNHNTWYLTIGLGLYCIVNFGNAALQKKQKNGGK